MKRAHTPHRISTASLAFLATLTLLMGVALGSCFFDTKTTLCESSGLRCQPGKVCAADQAACIDAGGCGDGVTNGDEACDDGNVIGGDGCSANCNSDETCGNGIVDVEKEECDPEVPGTTNCSQQCLIEACGNRVLDPGEVCDEGDQISGDGCRADCKSKEVCGDGITDAHMGETCEFENRPFPGRFPDTEECDNDCTLPECGDGHLNTEADEDCDPGAVNEDSQTCDRNCTTVQCGDGHRNQLAGEQCDDGTNNSSIRADACRTDCKSAHCGDHVEDTGEGCDDANESNNDACPNGPGGSCQTATCGDGFIRTMGMNPEQCDGSNAPCRAADEQDPPRNWACSNCRCMVVTTALPDSIASSSRSPSPRL
jgi:cysteine-rich repeat protein